MGVIETKICNFEGSRQCPLVHLVEVRLVCGICSISIFKEVGAAAMRRNVERLTFGGLHEKHAVQHGIWIPTQHLLWNQGNPRKTCTI
jgi:hypothetical protein